MNRRTLIRSATLAGLSFPIFSTLHQKVANLPDDLCILFQGDSITDAGRDKGRYYGNDNWGMGQGYVRHVVTELLGLNPTTNLRCYNRGISGNKVFQLAERWEEDCLMLKPDVLSVLIGVNDFWHSLSHGYEGNVDTYERDLRALLDRTIKALPEITIIIGEPFVLLEGSAIERDPWSRKFPAYQAISREIADEYKAVFIPYQQIFNRALDLADTSYWCPDGVHPSMAGNYLMANGWLEAFYSVLE